MYIYVDICICIHNVWLFNNIIIKACVRYFLSNFYFSPNDIPSKAMKNVFILSKKLISFLRYLNFCIFVFPPFFPCQPLR